MQHIQDSTMPAMPLWQTVLCVILGLVVGLFLCYKLVEPELQHRAQVLEAAATQEKALTE